MHAQYDGVVDGSGLGQIGEGLFDIGFECRVLKPLYQAEVGKLMSIAQVACCLEIAEGIEAHARSFFFSCSLEPFSFR